MKSTRHPDTPIIERKGVVMSIVGDGDKMTFIRFDQEPGSVTPEHSHPHEQIGTCIRGRGRLVSGGATLIVEPGVTWTIPGGEPHSFVVEGDEPTLIFEAFSPPRKDYLSIAEKK